MMHIVICVAIDVTYFISFIVAQAVRNGKPDLALHIAISK